MHKKLALYALALLVLVPGNAMAHQPRIVGGDTVEIEQPEVSQAFYGELHGAPVEFRIRSARSFRLYVGILVPAVPEARKDISAGIYRAADGGRETVALLDGGQSEWTPFFEEFAKNDYFWGPEFKADDSGKGVSLKGRHVPAGTYVITVFSPANIGKYSLVVGDREQFPLREIINAAVTVQRVKARFFGESPLQILFSPFGWGFILALYILAFAGGFITRALICRHGAGGSWAQPKKMRLADRLLGAVLGFALLVRAIATAWSPLLLLFSGFCFFHAIFGLCGRRAPLAQGDRQFDRAAKGHNGAHP